MATRLARLKSAQKAAGLKKKTQLKSQETLLWEQLVTPKCHDGARAALFFVIPGK